MPYSTIAKVVYDQLVNIVGQEFVLVDKDKLQEYGHDETEKLFFLHAVVVRP